ncbi:MAG: dTDP-glucose 4,6-dehydratase [Chloroflexi bacterium]|nr:dTDP-glucose 4,6-dehydratase [Chloroflexota bacterium]
MPSHSPRNMLVTGGAGFIGSAYVRLALADPRLERLTVLDKLTYAGNRANLDGVAGDPRFHFVQGDIADPAAVRTCLTGIDTVVNFAAETHVDRSIQDASSFVLTDVYGLHILLEASRSAGVERILHVSTDEVYGHVEHGSSGEDDCLLPRSPYAASKAGGDLLARAYFVTHGLPVVITRGSNTFGPRQYPEKMMPLFITNALDGLPVPVYGDGLQIREWISVDDHCRGIHTALTLGVPGNIYNVGSGHARTNLEVTLRILDLCGRGPDLIQHVEDRKAHDRRYSIDCTKLMSLGWHPERELEPALAETVAWYKENQNWWRPLRGRADFVEHYQRTYKGTSTQ